MMYVDPGGEDDEAGQYHHGYGSIKQQVHHGSCNAVPAANVMQMDGQQNILHLDCNSHTITPYANSSENSRCKARWTHESSLEAVGSEQNAVESAN